MATWFAQFLAGAAKYKHPLALPNHVKLSTGERKRRQKKLRKLLRVNDSAVGSVCN
jgi:hypothetical protein